MRLFRSALLLLFLPLVVQAQFGRVDVDTSALPIVETSQVELDLKDFDGTLTSKIQDMQWQRPAIQKGYEVYTRDNLSLYIKPDQQIILLIKGDTTPKYIRGIWDQFQGSKFKNLILYNVTPNYSQSNVSAKHFPGALGQVVNDHYGGALDLKSGQHALAQLEINGPMKEALSLMNYPTENLVASFGREVPELSWETGANAGVEKSKKNGKGDPTKALEATNYIEIFRKGDWPNAMGMTGVTITDATIYYDSGNVFGWWGVGEFEGEKLLSFYQGPLVKSKDPQDYLAAQVGFGAQNMTLAKYLKLTALYNSRFPGQSFAFAGPADEAKQKSLNALFTGLDALPLEIIRITQKNLANFKFKSGDTFPGPDKFNLTILGPLATGRDGSKGPFVAANGQAQFMGRDFSNLDFKVDIGRATLKTDGNIGFSLGEVSGQSLGRLGGQVSVEMEATAAAQSMSLKGSFEAGPLGGRGINIVLKQDQFDFSNPALCSFPFDVRATAKVQDLANLKPEDLLFIPQAGVPDPTALLNCPEDIYFLIKNGVAIAMNGTVKLAEFADSFLPENDITKIGIKGLKFANGAIIEGPEEMLNLARNVPGVGELEDLNNYLKDQATKAAAKAAAEAAKAAQKAAAEAARAAEAAVNQGLKQFDNFVRDPGGAIESVGGAISSVGGAIGGFFGGGGGSSIPGFGWVGPYHGIKAVDIGVGHHREPHTLKQRVWLVSDTGYPLQADDLGGGHFNFWYRNAGLTGNFSGFIRIDVDKDGYPAAIDKKGRLWTYNGSKWNLTSTYALDVGIGGGYIWIISTESQWGSYRIYRAPYASGRTKFSWEYMHGAGTKIDVGADGQAWAINKNFEVWEWIHNQWINRHGQAIDIAVSESNRAWVLSAADYNKNIGGGRVYTYETCHWNGFLNRCMTGIPARWVATAGFADTIGAGWGPLVWAVNSANNVFLGTGRR